MIRFSIETHFEINIDREESNLEQTMTIAHSQNLSDRD